MVAAAGGGRAGATAGAVMEVAATERVPEDKAAVRVVVVKAGPMAAAKAVVREVGVTGVGTEVGKEVE